MTFLPFHTSTLWTGDFGFEPLVVLDVNAENTASAVAKIDYENGGRAWDDAGSCSWPLSTASSACSSMSSLSAAAPRPTCSRRYFFSAIRFASSSARSGVHDGSPVIGCSLAALSRRLPRPAWASFLPRRPAARILAPGSLIAACDFLHPTAV